MSTILSLIYKVAVFYHNTEILIGSSHVDHFLFRLRRGSPFGYFLVLCVRENLRVLLIRLFLFHMILYSYALNN